MLVGDESRLGNRCDGSCFFFFFGSYDTFREMLNCIYWLVGKYIEELIISIVKALNQMPW